ncbi:hypothetical protein F7725_003239 [Dissostichus mawsoni]|uniref:Uncharacterized protein n=1 Tax=Dissostichus mawsoni TaxID=36200 RepID=A0A7J5YB15_DISMA|nr:hypothetical protein F7725_003239 [Dissostichus mawsoni]
MALCVWSSPPTVCPPVRRHAAAPPSPFPHSAGRPAADSLQYRNDGDSQSSTDGRGLQAVSSLVMRSFLSGPSAVAKLGSGVDELQVDLLHGTTSQHPLLDSHNTAFNHDEVIGHISIIVLCGSIVLHQLAILGVEALANLVDLLVDLCAVVVTLLTSTGHREGNTGRMPGTNTGNLTQTTMGLARKLLCAPTAGDTLVSVTLGDANNIDHLVLGEDVVNRHGLFQLLTGPVHLVSDAASVQLHLHQMRLLLRNGQQAHLNRRNKMHYLVKAFFLDLYLRPHRRRHEVGTVPVESALALFTDVLSEDSLEGPQATGCADVTNNSNHNHGRGLKNARSVDLADDVGHAGLVAQEGGKVHGLGGVILGEALRLTTMTTTPLAGQEAQGAVAGSRKFTVRLEGGKSKSQMSPESEQGASTDSHCSPASMGSL